MYLDKIIAHRGFSSKYPENTMLAFEQAVKIGASSLETDVTILKDDTLVLFHDYHTNDHSDFDGIIHDLDADMISKVDAGSWKDAQFASARIPMLRELLNLAKKTNTKINLELKGEVGKNEKYWDKIVADTVKMVHDMSVQDLVFYSSFEFPMLRTLKALDSNAKFGILLWEETKDWKVIADELKPQAMNLYDQTVTKELASEIKQEGYEIYVYTVNDKDDAKRLLDMGVDGIITDCPDKFI